MKARLKYLIAQMHAGSLEPWQMCDALRAEYPAQGAAIACAKYLHQDAQMEIDMKLLGQLAKLAGCDINDLDVFEDLDSNE